MYLLDTTASSNPGLAQQNCLQDSKSTHYFLQPRIKAANTRACDLLPTEHDKHQQEHVLHRRSHTWKTSASVMILAPRRTATMAAVFMRFMSSAPVKPAVARATLW